MFLYARLCIQCFVNDLLNTRIFWVLQDTKPIQVMLGICPCQWHYPCPMCCIVWAALHLKPYPCPLCCIVECVQPSEGEPVDEANRG
jgi:hypothetical protein